MRRPANVGTMTAAFAGDPAAAATAVGAEAAECRGLGSGRQPCSSRPPCTTSEFSMSNRIQIGEIVIQRIVEQERPFFEVLQFFPALTPEVLADNRGWLQPKFLDAEDKLVLCIQSYLVQT